MLVCAKSTSLGFTLYCISLLTHTLIGTRGSDLTIMRKLLSWLQPSHGAIIWMPMQIVLGGFDRHLLVIFSIDLLVIKFGAIAALDCRTYYFNN